MAKIMMLMILLDFTRRIYENLLDLWETSEEDCSIAVHGGYAAGDLHFTSLAMFPRLNKYVSVKKSV